LYAEVLGFIRKEKKPTVRKGEAACIKPSCKKGLGTQFSNFRKIRPIKRAKSRKNKP